MKDVCGLYHKDQQKSQHKDMDKYVGGLAGPAQRTETKMLPVLGNLSGHRNSRLRLRTVPGVGEGLCGPRWQEEEEEGGRCFISSSLSLELVVISVALGPRVSVTPAGSAAAKRR